MLQYTVCLNDTVSDNNVKVALRIIINSHWDEHAGLTPNTRYRADEKLYVTHCETWALDLQRRIKEELGVETYISVSH